MRKVLTNIGWIFFDKVFRMAASLLVGIWVARYLGPNNFGTLNYATLFPAIFLSIAGLGLTNVIMVEYIKEKDNVSEQIKLVSTSFFMKLAAGAVCYFLALVCNYIVNKDNLLLFSLINIYTSILLFQCSDVIDTYFQAQTKAKVSVIIKLLAFVVAVAGRVYGLKTSQSLAFFAYMNIIEVILVFLFSIAVYSKITKQALLKIVSFFDYHLVRKLIMMSWPVMCAEFFIFVYSRIDQFMIESLSSTHELGLYGAALRLSESWYFVSIAVATSFYPRIADFWLTNKEEFYRQYQFLIDILVYISSSLAIVVSIFSEDLISTLYGNEFKGAGSILSVHIWAGVFVFLGVGINNLMVVNNLQRFVLIKTIAGAGINIILNLFFIPKMGALGASIATLIAQALSSYLFNFFYVKSRSIFHIQSKSFVNFLTLKWLSYTSYLSLFKRTA
jgi:PST family polysaccharide transporter